MVKIQIDLNENEDRIVEVYKVVNTLKTKEESIKQMIRYFKVKIVPEKVDKDEEYYKRAIKFSEEVK
ncbi:Uncharacterised protein [uncultured archaeon]|nr:Uncharacterised protein [uncultured archaeon]